MALGAGDFERWWPEVAPRLTRALVRRGMTGTDAEDVVQETALRALAAAPPVASAEELRRWSFTVARRIAIDRARRRGRAEVVALDGARLPAATADVARAAEHRIAWATAMQGLAGLSATDRTVLLSVVEGESESGETVDRKAAVREAVRRHRARARLVAAVGKLVGVGVAAAHGVKRLGNRLRGSRVGLVVAAAGAILLLPSGESPTSAALPKPEPSASAAEAPAPPPQLARAPFAAASPAPVRRAPPPASPPPPTTTTTQPDNRDPVVLPIVRTGGLPSFTSSVVDIRPGRAVDCAADDPTVACMTTAVRVKGTGR